MKQILVIFLLLLSFLAEAQHKDLAKLYAKQKFDKLIEIGAIKLSKTPKDLVVNMMVGRAYVALDKYQKAIPFLEKIEGNETSLLWVKAWSLAELGTAYYHTGKVKKGIEKLKEAKDLKATRNCSRFVQKQLMRFQENEYFQEWKIYETDRIRFHFQDEKCIDNVDVYMQGHEQAYETINRFFKVEMLKKIDFFVWKNKTDAFDLFGKPLGWASPDRKIINAWYKQTKGHEICHILCDVAVQPEKKTKLINEGICVYFDQTTRNKMDEARKILPKYEFHLLELWESPTEYERGLSYPMGGAFIDFLIRKGGKQKMIKLLKNQTVENAEAIYPNFRNMVKTFEAMLQH